MSTKAFVILFYIFVLSVMLPLTCFLYSRDAIDIFSLGTSVISVYAPNRFISISLLMVTIAILLLHKRIRMWKTFSVFVILLWCLSGRTIGFYPLIVGINTGWFYISFNRFDLCSEKEKNCGLVLKHATVVEGFGNSFIKVQNHYVNKTIYTGPLIYEEAIAELRSLTVERDIDPNELPPK